MSEIKERIREREGNGLQAVWLRHHILKNGLKSSLGAKLRTKDRCDVESTSKIVVLEVQGVVWAGLMASSGKYHLRGPLGIEGEWNPGETGPHHDRKDPNKISSR